VAAVDLQQSGRAPDALIDTASDLPNQPAIDEVGDQTRQRGPSETGGLGEIGTGPRPLRVQQTQHERQVVAAHVKVFERSVGSIHRPPTVATHPTKTERHYRDRAMRRTIAAVVVVALTACGSTDDGAPSPPPTPSVIVAAGSAAASSVLIRAEGCRARPSRGVGGVIAPGRVVTVAHLVAGSTSVTVQDAAGTDRRAVVVGLDRSTDLALLAVDVDMPPLPRRTLPAGEQGSFVVDRDGPTTLSFTTEAFVDIRIDSIDGDRRVQRRGYQVQATIVDGDSGAVLVTNEGVAIGVLYARSTAAENRAWATDIAELDPLLAADSGEPVDVGACVGVAD
jgi:S1-C subfamily serine protease